MYWTMYSCSQKHCEAILAFSRHNHWRSQLDKWGGGGIFIYSCSAELISSEIDCFYSL